MLSKINQAHAKIGESLRQSIKKGAYPSCKKLGGLIELLGTGSLITTTASHYLWGRANNISGLGVFLGNLFYGIIPKNKKLLMGAYELHKGIDKRLLIAGYATSVALIIGGYLLRRKAKKKLN